MKLKQTASAVCAAAVVVSAVFSDMPVQLSGYSHAYAGETDPAYETDLLSQTGAADYYEHTEPGGAMAMTVTEATWDNDSGMSCAYTNDFDMPGVIKGTTTVGELKEMYAGIKVSGYSFVNSTVSGMTADDLVPTIVVMTGSKWDWSAVYNTDTMTFSEDLASIPDDDVVQAIGFHVSVQDGSFAKLGLNIGDSFIVNYTGADYFEYTSARASMPMTVKEADNAIGMICQYDERFSSVPGVSFGRTTIAQLKAMYTGIKVSGYTYKGSTWEGMTESDTVSIASPSGGFMGRNNNVYWTTPNGAVGCISILNDSRFQSTGGYHVKSDFGLFTAWLNMDGVSDADVYIYSVDAFGDISAPYKISYSELVDIGSSWTADFGYDESTGILKFRSLAPDTNTEDSVYDRRYKLYFGDTSVKTISASSSDSTVEYQLLGRITEQNLYKTDTFPAGTYTISVDAIKQYEDDVIAEPNDTYEFVYGGLSVSDSIGVPTGFRTNGNTIEWDKVDGVSGYIVRYSLLGTTLYSFVNDANDMDLVYEMSTADGAEPVISVCAVDSSGKISGFSDEYTAEYDESYNVHFDGNVLYWNSVRDADHYEVSINGMLLDFCLSNNSANYSLAMSLNNYELGSYVLDVTAVFADDTRKLLGSVEYQYKGSDWVGFVYSDNADGTITITGGNVSDAKLEIPAEIDGKKVTAIGDTAFSWNKGITELVIPEGVKSLGWYSFNSCTSLETVSLPESLEFIDSWAFESCTSLKTISIPANVSVINAGAFAQDDSLMSITCSRANKNYVSVDGVLFTKDMSELVAYPGGISGGYTVPASVNHIGDAAFYGAAGLDSVEILGNLDFIGFEAFARCSSLTDVVIRDGVNYVGYWAFRGCSGIKMLTVPQSVTNIGDQAFGYADYGDVKQSGFKLRGYKDSAVYYYSIRHDIPFICIGEASEDNKPFDKDNSKESEVDTNPDAADEDKITTIIATPAFNMKDKSESGVGLDLSKIKVKAKEIYDEEGIRRAEAALGTEISGNKKYNLLDLTLVNGDVDFSNGYDGLVEVVIPIPAGHRDKEFYCYRLLDDGTKQLIPGKRRDDCYVVYLEHFSVYALVADSGHTCTFSDNWTNSSEGHWHECVCGKTTEIEAHTAGGWITDLKAASDADGHRYIACTVCGYVLEEEMVIWDSITILKML